MVFFRVPDEKDLTFSDLIDKYKSYLQSVDYPYQEFVDELTQFNRRRNRIVHQLWRKEFSFTNQKGVSLKLTSQAARPCANSISLSGTETSVR